MVNRRSLFRRTSLVDVSGISQVPWRSIPCLCPAPRPRPSRQNLAPGGSDDAAPGPNTPKALSNYMISGLTLGFSIHCLRFTNSVAAVHARLASGWRAAPLPGGGRTLWIASKGFRIYIPFSFPGLSLSQGSSMPSRPSPGQRRCSPISPVTPTASPSQTAACLPSTSAASPSTTRIIAALGQNGSRS